MRHVLGGRNICLYRWSGEGNILRHKWKIDIKNLTIRRLVTDLTCVDSCGSGEMGG